MEQKHDCSNDSSLWFFKPISGINCSASWIKGALPVAGSGSWSWRVLWSRSSAWPPRGCQIRPACEACIWGRFKTCCRPSRLWRIEASAGFWFLTVMDVAMSTSQLCCCHFLVVSVSFKKKNLFIRPFVKEKAPSSYHSGGLFVSSTPYISASFLKRGPQSFR